MNIAIGNKTSGRNIRLGVGAFVTALSVATIAGVSIWHLSDSSSPQTVAEGPVIAAALRPIEPAAREVTPVVYYLVNSQDQVDALVQAEFEASANNNWAQSDLITHVIDVGTQEGQALARDLQTELYYAATDPYSGFDPSLIKVHDLTAEPLPATTKAVADFVSASTRTQATMYIVGSEAERQTLLLEADTAAAVEGASAELPDVIVVETVADQQEYSMTLLELTLSTEPVSVVDLRN